MAPLLGRQLQYVASVIDAKRQPVDAGMDAAEAQEKAALAAEYSKVVMQVLVSGAILAFSFYVILTKTGSDQLEKAAFGFIGTVVGYWLR